MLMVECICEFTGVISLAIVLKYVIVGVEVVYMERGVCFIPCLSKNKVLA